MRWLIGLFLPVFAWFVPYGVLAQEALNDFPGSIPFSDDRGFATDLVDENGDEIWPDDVALRKDPDLLNPEESSIWKKTPLLEMPSLNTEESGENFLYFEAEPSPISRLNFSVMREGSGSIEFFRIHMSRQAHNILLRAALLRKMGYRVPAVKWLKNFTLRFGTNNERNEFIDTHLDPNKLTALPDRWVKNLRQVETVPDDDNTSVKWVPTAETAHCKCLHIQDALVYTHNTHLYNFPAGISRSGFHHRRRSFEALLMPFSFTYIDESINLVSWHFGTTVNNRLFVDYEPRYRDEFFPTYSDAKWAARKMLALSRSDWREVVEYARLPRAVEKILLEKFISRRNDLIAIFNLGSEFTPIDLEKRNFHHVSKWGTELEDGKLLRRDYPGYAPKFAYGDPESPLSSSELLAFGKAKVISNVISNAVTYFNDNLTPRTDVEAAIGEKQLQLAVDQLIKSQQAGQFVEHSFGTFTVPYANTRLVISRDVVSGKIMGTENPIQMAHTFGWSVEAGALVMGYGLPTNVSLNGRAAGYFTRTYSHLKPIKSIKKALKEPFKNIFVPMITKRIGRTLERVINGEFDDLNRSVDFSKMSEEEIASRRTRENELIEFLTDFNAEFSPGESLIITDYLGALGEVTAGYSLSQKFDLDKSLQLNANLRGDLKKLNRLHIHRESESAIQIYDDEGEVIRFEFSIGLNAIRQNVVRVRAFTTAGGHANTRFVRLNTNTERNEKGELQNTQLLDNLKIFGGLLLNGDKDLLFAQRKPTILWHKFAQRGIQSEVLLWQSKYLNTLDLLAIENAGEHVHFVRHARAWRSGKNYEKFAVDTANTAISEAFDEVDIAIDTSTAEDPGYSFHGKSRARVVMFEAEVADGPRGDATEFKTPYGRVEHRWRGWSANVKQLRKYLDEINRLYPVSDGERIELFRPFDLKSTTKIELYSLSLTMHVYKGAIERIRSVSKARLTKAYEMMAEKMNWSRRVSSRGREIQSVKSDWVRVKVNNFLCYRRKRSEFRDKKEKRAQGGRHCLPTQKSLWHYEQTGELSKQSRRYTDLIHQLEEHLDWPTLVWLLTDPKTGNKDLYVEVRVEGFRSGDENVDPKSLLHRPYRANSLGEIGDVYVRGPLDYIRQNLGMTESEMFIYWILERI